VKHVVVVVVVVVTTMDLYQEGPFNEAAALSDVIAKGQPAERKFGSNN